MSPTNRSRTLGLEENLEGSHITNFKKLYMCLCNLCVSMLVYMEVRELVGMGSRVHHMGPSD